MYALVEIKGKQYKAEKDAVLKVDKLEGETGSKIEFDSVLLLSDGDRVSVGQPFVKNAKVVVTVQDLKKDKKVTTVKFKKRKGYMRTIGHRQAYSFVKVEEVVG